MVERETPRALRDELRGAWHRFVDALAPLRPALHGYCRRLAGNAWDAEDLVQDTLLRAFGHWGVTAPEIRNPRAYLLRTATNVWIDTLRQRERQPRPAATGPEEQPGRAAGHGSARAVRDAGAQLLGRLSPQERAAVLLKEGFDMSLEEIAELLATTTGAVKAALHRGRGHLHDAEREPARGSGPSPELLDRFIERFEARDVTGLVALMLDGATAENVGNSYHVGLDAKDGVLRFLHAVVHGHPEWPDSFQSEGRRLARADFAGEPILLGFATRHGREKLQSAFRLEEREGRISRIRSYAFCPETIREIGAALGLPVRTGIYRAPDPSAATAAG